MLCFLVVVAALGFSFERCVRALHILQLDSYHNGRFLRWLLARPARLGDVRSTALGAITALGALGLGAAGVRGGPFVAAMVWVAGCAVLTRRGRRAEPAKKPLVYTARAVRILVMSMVLLAVAAALASAPRAGAGAAGSAGDAAGVGVAASIGLGWLLIQLAPFFVVLANIGLQPVQALINAGYVRAARKKLQKLAPTVIGITGSYGKTSTKYFTESILTSHYGVLKTPGSFNTLLGICRVINGSLARSHEMFVVEMGAYLPGDIAEIAALVHPRIGVLTAIGPQHLERFGSIEAIQEAKYELIQSLPRDGVAIFNGDDARCAALADRTTHTRVMRYGAAPGERFDVWAENVEYTEKGLNTDVVTRAGDRFRIRAGVLGRHNLSNVLAAVCVAKELGLSNGEIVRGCLAIRAAPHRLELLGRADGAIVIDDSYNSNPVGAINALDVLGEFKTGARILVTPGMIELGPEQERWNEELGVKAAQTCDRVILVGPKQTRPILKGLEKAGFPAEARFVARDLNEARRHLDTFVKSGDVILFENDLPDLYAET